MTTPTPARLTAEELELAADNGVRFFDYAEHDSTIRGLRQAAHDYRVLQQLRAWLDTMHGEGWAQNLNVRDVLAKLDELEAQ